MFLLPRKKDTKMDVGPRLRLPFQIIFIISPFIRNSRRGRAEMTLGRTPFLYRAEILRRFS